MCKWSICPSRHHFEYQFYRFYFHFHYDWQAQFNRSDQKRLKPVDIPAGRIDINITHIVSVDEFYCVLSSRQDELNTLEIKLNDDLGSGGKGDIVPVPMIGVCYITNIKRAWYRAKLLTNNGHGRFDVCLIDVAKRTTVTWNNLFHMANKYHSVPDCSLQMSLHDLTGDDTMKEALTAKFLQFHQQSKSYTAKIECGVVEQCHSVTLHSITHHMERICVNYELNKLMTNDLKPKPSEVSERLAMWKEAAFRKPNKNASNKRDVTVTHYKTPGDFYVMLVDDVERLRKIEADIGEYCEQETCKAQSMEWNAGDPCYVKKDEKWHRGVVLNSGANICLVYLIDHGNQIRVHMPEDLMLPKDENDVPGMSIKCHLAFLQPTNRNDWAKTSIEQCSVAWHQAKKLAISVPRLRTSTASVAVVLWCYGEMEVPALSAARQKIRNINLDMIHSGLARSTTLDHDEFMHHECKLLSEAIDNKRLLDGLINDNNGARHFVSSSSQSSVFDPSEHTFKWSPAATVSQTTLSAKPRHIDTNMYIYAQTTEQTARCDQMSQILTTWHQDETAFPKITNWKEGEACVTRFTDGCYHRAQVLSVDKLQKKCKVLD